MICGVNCTFLSETFNCSNNDMNMMCIIRDNMNEMNGMRYIDTDITDI